MRLQIHPRKWYKMKLLKIKLNSFRFSLFRIYNRHLLYLQIQFWPEISCSMLTDLDKINHKLRLIQQSPPTKNRNYLLNYPSWVNLPSNISNQTLQESPLVLKFWILLLNLKLKINHTFNLICKTGNYWDNLRVPSKQILYRNRPTPLMLSS